MASPKFRFGYQPSVMLRKSIPHGIEGNTEHHMSNRDTSSLFFSPDVADCSLRDGP